MNTLLKTFQFGRLYAIAFLLVFSLSSNAQETQGLEDPIGDEKAQQALKDAGAQGTGISLKLGSTRIKLGSNEIISKAQDISGVQGIIFDSSGFGFKISLSGDYFFAYDKSDLLPAARESLTKIYTLIEEYEATALMIVGHTDAHGSDEYNQTLSVKRANSTRQWFIDAGLQSSIIQTQGRGEREPTAPNTLEDGSDNPDGRAKNRRVDLDVTTRKKVNSVPVQ